jgi:hypothetical protein
LAKFIVAFVRKFAPILGLDIRSEAEKELQRLRDQQQQSAAVVSAGGQFGVVPESLRPASLTPEQLARIIELEQQVAAEAAGSILNQFQANFNAAIDTASRKLEEKMAPPGGEAGGLEIQERQLRELQQLNRNGQIGTVEILN